MPRVATSNWPQPDRIENEHVSLELLREDLAPELIAAADSPATFRYFSRGPDPFDEAGMRAFIAFLLGPAETQPFAVFDRASERYVGITTYYDLRPAHQSLEIGWTWYAPSVRGTAVNPACKRLLLGHAFDTLGAHRVALRTDARNTASRRAMEKLGAQHEGLWREHVVMPDGHRRTSAYYSILSPEWPGVRAGLDERLAAVRRNS